MIQFKEYLEIGTKEISYKYKKDTPGKKMIVKRRFTKSLQNSTNNKKEKSKMYLNDKKTQKIAETVKELMKSREESNAFTAAAAAAKLAGKKEFEFEGKKYPVKIKDAAAKAITGESVEVEEATELDEGRFDKLEKKLGRINPESLEAVMSGKIKLNPAEKKEFDEFMKGVQKMFASKQY